MGIALNPAARACRFTDPVKRLLGFQIPGNWGVVLVVGFFHQTLSSGPI